MTTQTLTADTLITNAKVFNNGEPPIIEDVAILDGKIIARGKDIDQSGASRVINAEGHWLMPGLFDIHTHYDLELEVSPGLPESTRHGTTTVVIANCSLGLAYGNQRKDGTDPIVDCYARVENLPKSLLRSCADRVDWNSPKEYLEHLDGLNLGPNVATLFPHSMLRINAMGFQDSISRSPSKSELQSMESELSEALALGYVGFSTDALPFHYLANQPNCDKTIPTQFAKYGEIKKLTQVVRDKGAVWQATPPKDSMIDTIKTFLLTSGRLHKKPLRTTLVAALDVSNNKKLLKMARLMAKVLNSKFLDGDFHLQALGAPFKIWSDGVITPLAEEIPELRRLNETDVEDRAARQAILSDPVYIKTFRAMWMKGKQGFNIDRLKRILDAEDYAFNRTMGDMNVEVCKQENWVGMDMQTLLERVLSIKSGDAPADVQEDEQALIKRDFFWIADEADFMLQLLRTFDIGFCWSTTTANRNPVTTRELIMDPLLLPGFNDSGAHLTNMAFYDVNLRCLKQAASGGDADVSYMVKRLTKDAADVFGVDGGTINEGDVADLILINPETLNQYDGEANVARVHRKEYDHEQLVNRSEGVVPLVMIGGNVAWENDQFSDNLGNKPMGRLLRGKAASTKSELKQQMPQSKAA